ncbi:MAG TPA: NmrA family NAD(P)-binding protein [Rhizobiaceae bacterium]|nr:NmrA family NAD(P)-binding protein [Rhizobiaceae bacterium]
MKTVIVLGAAGRIGDAAARSFLAAGWRVKGLVRNTGSGRLPAGVEPVRGDATDRAALIEACKGSDVILNALNPLYTEWAEKVMPMAENVVAAAEATDATHLLPGNVYNFGYGIPVGAHEDTPEMPSTEKAEIRIAMEGLFREAAEARGVRTVVLRAGDFYGGSRPGSWLDLIILAKLRKDVFTWGGPMDIPHAFAYLPDLGRAFVALAEKRHELEPFERFHFAGHTLSGDQMKAAAEAAIGRRLSARTVPWIALRAAGLVSPMMREVARMSYLWRTPHSLDGAKLEWTVGKLPLTEPVEAIRRAIADLALDDNRAAA